MHFFLLLCSSLGCLSLFVANVAYRIDVLINIAVALEFNQHTAHTHTHQQLSRVNWIYVCVGLWLVVFYSLINT